MADTTIAVVTYSSVLFNVGGNCRRWANRVEHRFTNAAQQFAPARTGVLRAGIKGTVYRTGPHHVIADIWSEAEYSLYVLRGTTGPIRARRLHNFRGRTGLQYPRGTYITYQGRQIGLEKPLRERGYLLRVRAGNGHPQRYMEEVEGQDENNFFAAAAQETAFRHPSLRGWAPGVTGI